MPKDRKLKAALDRHKGVDHKLEHQKKLQKEARKRKGQTREQKLDIGEVEEAVASAEEDDEAQTLARVSEQLQNEHLAARDAQLAEKLGGEADGWETDGSDDVEIEDEGGITLGTIDDESESDSEIEAAFSNTKIISNGLNGNANGDEDEDEDIPLSDIDSLDSDAQADIVPYQRLTINNTAALQRSLKSFALPSNLPFSAAQSITSSEPVVIADVEDDLNRELALYRQSLDAVAEAREKLKKEGAPFSRPTDYFAEMVKSEEQMGKVRQKLVDEAARKKASADARRQRDLKKFGKAVQVAKLQERQKQKKDTLDRISTLKRSKSSKSFPESHIHVAAKYTNFSLRTTRCRAHQRQ